MTFVKYYARSCLLGALGGVIAGLPFLLDACTPAQGQVIVQSLPADAALAACIFEGAFAGDSLGTIAQTCASDAATVATYLLRVAKPQASMVSSKAEHAARVAGTPAYAEAYALRMLPK